MLKEKNTKKFLCLKEKKNPTLKLLIKLFLSSLYVSALSFGGGFVALKLLKEVYQKKYNLVTKDELIEINSIAQTAPGSIAFNSVMLIGYKSAGLKGSLVTCVASLIPPMLIIAGLYYFYDAIKNFEVITYIMKGMQAGVAAVILSLSTELWKDTLCKKQFFDNIILISAFLLSFLSIFIFNLSIVIYLVILSAIIGVAFTMVSSRGSKKK